MNSPELVILGRLDGAWGVKGWLRVYSHADPPAAIFGYQPWYLEGHEQPRTVLEWRHAGPRLVARLVGVDTPEQADTLKGLIVRIPRTQLPQLPDGHYYWRDLEGLTVLNREGVHLGRVQTLLATGAHDVLVIEGRQEVLIPFVPGVYIDRVDQGDGTIYVHWPQDWLE